MRIIGHIGYIYGDENSLVSYPPAVEEDGNRFILQGGRRIPVTPSNKEYTHEIETSKGVDTDSSVLIFLGNGLLHQLTECSSYIPKLNSWLKAVEEWESYKEFKWTTGMPEDFENMHKQLSDIVGEKLLQAIDAKDVEGIHILLKAYEHCFDPDEGHNLRIQLKAYEFLKNHYAYDVDFTKARIKILGQVRTRNI